jgi:hypothetical protein
MRSDNGHVIGLSKRVADTVVVSAVPPALFIDIFLFVLLETYLGTSISLLVFILLALVVLGFLPRLHKQITSGRLVIDRGNAMGLGVLSWINGLVFLLVGPPRTLSFAVGSQPWTLWNLIISCWFLLGTMGILVDRAIVNEPHQTEESSIQSREDSDENEFG